MISILKFSICVLFQTSSKWLVKKHGPWKVYTLKTFKYDSLNQICLTNNSPRSLLIKWTKTNTQKSTHITPYNCFLALCYILFHLPAQIVLKSRTNCQTGLSARGKSLLCACLNFNMSQSSHVSKLTNWIKGNTFTVLYRQWETFFSFYLLQVSLPFCCCFCCYLFML